MTSMEPFCMSLEIGKYVEYLTYVSSCVLAPLQVWLVTLQYNY